MGIRRILSDTMIFGMLLLGISIPSRACSVPPSQHPPSDATALLPQEIIQAWIDRLSDTRVLGVELRCSRIVYGVDEHGAKSSTVREHRHILARAFMAADSFLLSVWETNDTWSPTRPDASLIMTFVDHEVHERLWIAAANEYRSRRYPATSRLGALDTDHPDGCQFGTLLYTWLATGGDSMISSLTALKNLCVHHGHAVIDDVRCAVLRNTDAPTVDPENGNRLYQRVDDNYFDDVNVLRRWTTTVFTALDKSAPPAYIVQERNYEFTFFDELPAEYLRTLENIRRERTERESKSIDARGDTSPVRTPDDVR